MKEIVSEPLPNRDYTSDILNKLNLMHREFFDILVLTENRPNHVSPEMRARLYILDNCIVRTMVQIDDDQKRACPVLKELCDRLGHVNYRMWTPHDVRSIRRCWTFAPPIP